jgi:hypothetical protein
VVLDVCKYISFADDSIKNFSSFAIHFKYTFSLLIYRSFVHRSKYSYSVLSLLICADMINLSKYAADRPPGHTNGAPNERVDATDV